MASIVEGAAMHRQGGSGAGVVLVQLRAENWGKPSTNAEGVDDGRGEEEKLTGQQEAE
jgi:hypothetical protein